MAHPDIQFHFLPSQVIDHGRVASKIEAYQVGNMYLKVAVKWN